MEMQKTETFPKETQEKTDAIKEEEFVIQLLKQSISCFEKDYRQKQMIELGIEENQHLEELLDENRDIPEVIAAKMGDAFEDDYIKLL